MTISPLPSIYSAVNALPSLPSKVSPLLSRARDVFTSFPSAVKTGLKGRVAILSTSSLVKGAIALTLLGLVVLVTRAVWRSFQGRPISALPASARSFLTPVQRSHVDGAIAALDAANGKRAAEQIEAFMRSEESEQVRAAFRQGVPVATLYEAFEFLSEKTRWGFQDDPRVAYAVQTSQELPFSIPSSCTLVYPEGKSFSKLTFITRQEFIKMVKHDEGRDPTEEEMLWAPNPSMTLLGEGLSQELRDSLDSLLVKQKDEEEEKALQAEKVFGFFLSFSSPARRFTLEVGALRSVMLRLEKNDRFHPFSLENYSFSYSPKQQREFLMDSAFSRYMAFIQYYDEFFREEDAVAEREWSALTPEKKEEDFSSILSRSGREGARSGFIKSEVFRGLSREAKKRLECLFILHHLFHMSREGKNAEEWRSFWRERVRFIEKKGREVLNKSSTLFFFKDEYPSSLIPFVVDQGWQGLSEEINIQHFCDLFVQSVLEEEEQGVRGPTRKQDFESLLKKVLYNLLYHKESSFKHEEHRMLHMRGYVLHVKAQTLLEGVMSAFGHEKVPESFLSSLVTVLTQSPSREEGWYQGNYLLDGGEEGRKILDSLVAFLRQKERGQDADSLQAIIDSVVAREPVPV